jgi:hypothetical protein
MAKITRFEDIESWKKSRKLTKSIYRNHVATEVFTRFRCARSNSTSSDVDLIEYFGRFRA